MEVLTGRKRHRGEMICPEELGVQSTHLSYHPWPCPSPTASALDAQGLLRPLLQTWSCSHRAPRGHIILLVTEDPALRGLWFRRVDDLAQEDDALGVGGKDHHEEGPVEPKDSAIVPGRHKGDKASSGPCCLGAKLIHLQNGFVETLRRKSQVLPLRKHESGLREAWTNQRSLEINTAGHLLGISQQECLHRGVLRAG